MNAMCLVMISALAYECETLVLALAAVGTRSHVPAGLSEAFGDIHSSNNQLRISSRSKYMTPS
jgi:hypothetical protein